MNRLKKIIILVEGLEMQVFISTVLKEALFTPVTAEHIDDALEKIITQNPLLIIIDMMMPKEQGVKMYRQIKTHEKFKNLPVIMLSTLAKEAFFQFQHIEYTLPHQGLPKPEGYLSKPLETEELIYTIRKIIKNQPERKTKCL
ncbi:MAG: response regulator [Desulfobacteraceae bacterium]|nr:response regulator [Desulfobacteraceae bacterium]